MAQDLRQSRETADTTSPEGGTTATGPSDLSPSFAWTSDTFPPAPYPQFRETYQAADGSGAPLFHGRRDDILLRPGMLLTIRDVVTLCDVTGWREVGPALHLGIMKEARGHTVLRGTSIPFIHPTNRISLQTADRPLHCEVFLPAGTPIRYIDARFAPDVLIPLFREPPLSQTQTAMQFPNLDAQGVRLSLLPIPQAARRLAAQILSTDAHTACGRLLLEGKVLELLVLALEMHQRTLNSPSAAEACPVLTAGDRRRLAEARDLLVADLEHTWLVRDLARRVGLNEAKLKSGFRQIYGNSVYAYLQDQRMRAAASMLAQDVGSVTNIALAVGYANPAHFARIFRRYHGVSPSRFAEAPSPHDASESQKIPDPA